MQGSRCRVQGSGCKVQIAGQQGELLLGGVVEVVHQRLRPRTDSLD